MELEEKIKTLNKAIDILFSQKEKQTIFRSTCIDFEPELFELSRKEKTQKTLLLFSFYEIIKIVSDFEKYKEIKPFVFSKTSILNDSGVVPIFQFLIIEGKGKTIGKCVQYLSGGVLKWKVNFYLNGIDFTLIDTFDSEKEVKEYLKKSHNFTTIVKRLKFLRYEA